MTPVHRLGGAHFRRDRRDRRRRSFLDAHDALDRPPAVAVVGAGADLLRDRRQERVGRRDHRDVYRHGAGGAGLSSVFDDGTGNTAGVGDQHLDRPRAGAGSGGDDARGPGRVGDGGRAGNDARHRADRRALRARDQPDLLPGRAPVPGVRALDPALDPDGRFHGGDRRRGRQHADPQHRLVRLLDAYPRFRRQPRYLRRAYSRAISSARRLRLSVATAASIPRRGPRGSGWRRPRRSCSRSSRSSCSISCWGWPGTTFTVRSGPRPRDSYEPRPGQERAAETT